MFNIFTRISETTGVEPQMLIAAGVFLGAFLVFLSLVMTFRERAGARTLQRMSAAGDATAGLFVAPESDPSSIAKAFLPTKRRERAKVRRDLAHAGFTGPNAVIKYYMIRVGIGLLLPAALAAMILMRDQLPIPSSIDIQLSKIGPRQMMIGLGIMILIGFYGPAIWLSARATERRERIEQNFPNALDLLQVSVESGLGFDAALSRVATELSVAAPDLSYEFDTAQREILAGRDRDAAYQDMAERLGIEEAFAFVNVVLQSMRFGTSMGQALLAYSADMRQRREIRAQEKANKLPVYMSAVMASLMMPSLLIVTIGPVVLRYISTFN
ncbi:tight adherence protein C [Roseovarius azorensis]|uniref:Tight adherence protein C n=1 Tax=Roseovarius azorensis TaxID=1287727 RepID=A0A1H7N6D1_9RHOB|nr:type II secretion system F family protein [Roseovarius azorensis]SEL18974.1 tight adherence protein C [Roseovarius azorensis]